MLVQVHCISEHCISVPCMCRCVVVELYLNVQYDSRFFVGDTHDALIGNGLRLFCVYVLDRRAKRQAEHAEATACASSHKNQRHSND